MKSNINIKYNTDVEQLRQIDYRTPTEYEDYYTKLLPFFRQWYAQPEGYRPTVIGRNLSWWLTRNETRRKCRYKYCKHYTEEEHPNQPCQHSILAQGGTDKMSTWICELNKDDKKRQLSSGWERYKDPFRGILWHIDDIIKKPSILSIARSLYWQPAIRDNNLINNSTDKSWFEIRALNIVIDIDIINKNVRSILEPEIYNTLHPFLCKTAQKIEAEDLTYKIQFSGNGIYFITSKIIATQERQPDENLEQFWNIIVAGFANYVNKDLKPLEDKFKFFNIEGRESYTMQFLKTPLSLHQRLDNSAVPITIDQINSMNVKEFEEYCKPENVIQDPSKYMSVWR